jgi:PAS domain S-box-containing protein
MAKRRNRKFRLESLLQDTATPIFVLNLEREIVYFNAACEKLTGRHCQQVVGLCCRYSGPTGTQDLPDLAASLAPPAEVMGGQAMAVQTLVVRHDGERRWQQVHFFPCTDADGSLTHIVGLITEPAAARSAPGQAHIELHASLLRLRDRLYRRYGIQKVIASSDAMARVLAQVRLAARSDSHVLIWGEPGSGKGMLARTIHVESERKPAPFVVVDCAALPPALLERDLFGPDRSDSYRSENDGLLRSVSRGTVFLKNLMSMPRDTQFRLAEFLKSRTSQAETSSGSVAVRVIAADTEDPAHHLSSDRIRPDLYLLLSTITIAVPPLRERKGDLPHLAQSFVESCNASGAKQVSGLTAAALELLLAYDWPGNVRELCGTIADAHERCKSSLIGAEDITLRIQGALGGAFAAKTPDLRVDLAAVLAGTERHLIEQAVKRARGNKSVAADLLSISRPRLYRRMQLLGMDGADEEEPKAENAAEPESSS